MAPKGRLRWALIFLLALVCLNALVASYAFISDPSGEGIGIPQSWLEDSPFDDYLVPGLLLGGLGLLHGFAALRQWTGARDGWVWAGASGASLLVWIVVQAIMMGSFRHPIQTVLQASCLLVGSATGLMALLQMRQQPVGGPLPGRARSYLPRLVLVASDASHGMLQVEDVAARLARRMGAEIHVIVVGPREEGRPAEDDVLFAHAAPEVDRAAGDITRRFAARGVPVVVHVERGSVAQVLVATERRLRPDVMLFGHAERAQLEFPGYGNLIDQVKNQVAASVFVVHPRRFDSVAVGIDGSEPSLEAAATARRWAEAFGMPLTILLGEGAKPPEGLTADRTVLVQEPAGKFLLDWSRQHPRTLLVLGARGLGNPGLLRMGSVSDRLAWGSGGSVLIVRARRPAREH